MLYEECCFARSAKKSTSLESIVFKEVGTTEECQRKWYQFCKACSSPGTTSWNHCFVNHKIERDVDRSHGINNLINLKILNDSHP